MGEALITRRGGGSGVKVVELSVSSYTFFSNITIPELIGAKSFVICRPSNYVYENYQNYTLMFVSYFPELEGASTTYFPNSGKSVYNNTYYVCMVSSFDATKGTVSITSAVNSYTSSVYGKGDYIIYIFD